MRAPVLRISLDELVVDNFAGGGGASTGIGMALGRDPDIAVNHDAEALAMHAANHPATRHLREDVFAVDPVEVCGGRRVGLAWFSPDCFPAGTMVLAREGYRPIEEIEVGDEVLTHEGRWRLVTDVMRSVKPLVRLRGHGHPGLLVSPEHPFYARKREDVWSTEKPRGYRRNLHEPGWQRAGDLEAGWYWATPSAFPQDCPPEVPVYKGRSMTIDSRLMWLAGLYVADGWTRLTDTRAELVITCGESEVERLRARLIEWKRDGLRAGSDEMAWHDRSTYSAHQFSTNHRGLVEWLREHFGHGAAEKRVPGWLLGCDGELRRAFLDGYLSGDGCVTNTKGNALTSATTVSKALAFGIKALAASFGWSASLYLRQNTNVIQGRKVNARPAWSVRWREKIDAAHVQTFREGPHEWSAVKGREDDVAADAEVFNLSVEEDESYVADGIVVHNCTHFSKAKGGKPVSRKRRGLAWVVIRWATKVRPRVIALENVEEFTTWGPVGKDGRPDRARTGRTFRAWVGKLRKLGYVVEWRELRACDYGAPTWRKRLFLVARCDGQPIIWPEPTHGPRRAKPYRAAAECIDWTDLGRSIFERKRPLADATCRRIAHGFYKFVVHDPQPFILPLTHHGGDSRSYSIYSPLPTVTGAHRGEFALVAPTLVQTGYGEREGQAPRALDIRQPLGTIVAAGSKHALVAAFLAKHYGGPNGHQTPGTSLRLPFDTITTQDHHALVAAHLVKLYGTSEHGARMQDPMPTVTAGGNHLAAIAAFMVAYYGNEADGGSLFEPTRTITTKDRFALVTVMIGGVQYVVVDIRIRMLKPPELFPAQGFPRNYVIAPVVNGKPLSLTAQTRMVGNSASPQNVAAVVRAQFSATDPMEAFA